MENVQNKWLILEIKESNTMNYEVDFDVNYEVEFDVNYQTSKGFDTLTDAKKKLSALVELSSDKTYHNLQYKIIQIAFESAYKTHKKTA